MKSVSLPGKGQQKAHLELAAACFFWCAERVKTHKPILSRVSEHWLCAVIPPVLFYWQRQALKIPRGASQFRQGTSQGGFHKPELCVWWCIAGYTRGSGYGVMVMLCVILPTGRDRRSPRLPFCIFLKARLIILRLRTQCPALGENAWDTGWVMDAPIPLLSAAAIISYLSCNSSASLRSGPVLLGSE